MFPVPNGPITGDTGNYIFGGGQRGVEDYVIGRVDYQPSTNTSIYGAYSFDNTNSSSPDVFNQKLVGSQSRDQRVTLSLQHSFGPTLLNTISTGFSRAAETGNIDEPGSSNVPAYANTALGFFSGENPGNITVTGILGAPGGIGASGGGQGWWTDPQLSDHLDWVKGRNDIRIGFSVEAIRDSLTLQSIRSVIGRSARSKTS